jgi:hypothetical protein
MYHQACTRQPINMRTSGKGGGRLALRYPTDFTVVCIYRACRDTSRTRLLDYSAGEIALPRVCSDELTSLRARAWADPIEGRQLVFHIAVLTNFPVRPGPWHEYLGVRVPVQAVLSAGILVPIGEWYLPV